MNRETAKEILYENYAHLCAQKSLSPDQSILTQDQTEDFVLDLDNKALGDHHSAAILSALKVDGHFKELRMADNSLGPNSMNVIADLMKEDASSLAIIRLERNQITEEKALDLLSAKKIAQIQYKRIWKLYLDENPIKPKTIKSLKSNFLSSHSPNPTEDLDLTYNERAKMKYLGDDSFKKEIRNMIENSQQPESRSISPVNQKNSQVVNYRNTDLESVPYHLQNSFTKALALGNNKIKRLCNFPSSLLKLELCNNFIKKIEKLDSCTVLKVLDLSQNQISKIEGLRNCKHLQELSLGSNNIKQVENIEMLKKLSRLNLENNLLSSAGSIRALSLSTNLKLLVLKGNPISVQGKYRPTILGFIPKLASLDYMPLPGNYSSFSKADPNFFSSSMLSLDTKTSSTPKYFNPEQKHNFYKAPKSDIRPKKNQSPKKEEKPLERFKPSSNRQLSQIRNYFKSIYIFKGLPNPFIEALIKSSYYFVKDSSEIIVRYNSIVEKALVVISGKIKYKSQIYSKGESLFVESLILPEQATEDVVVCEKSRYLELYKSDLESLASKATKYKEIYTKNYFNNQIDKPSKEAQTSQVPKLDFKSLGMKALEIKDLEKSQSAIKLKVQKEIEDLLNSADPYDLSLPETPPSYDYFKNLENKVDALYTVYEKERSLQNSKKNIEKEAFEFVNTIEDKGPEFTALNKSKFKEISELVKPEPNEESFWMKDLVSSIEKEETKKIQENLEARVADLKEEVSTQQLTLSNLLKQKNASKQKIQNYKEILEECDLLKMHEDPAPIIDEICGKYLSEESIKELADEIMQLTFCSNQMKQSLTEVFEHLEAGNQQGISEIEKNIQSFIPGKTPVAYVPLKMPVSPNGDYSPSEVSSDD